MTPRALIHLTALLRPRRWETAMQVLLDRRRRMGGWPRLERLGLDAIGLQLARAEHPPDPSRSRVARCRRLRVAIRAVMSRNAYSRVGTRARMRCLTGRSKCATRSTAN